MPVAYGRKRIASLDNGWRDISVMSSPEKVTDKGSGRRRLPLQARQSALTRNCAARRFILALSVLANVSSTYRRAPTNVPR